MSRAVRELDFRRHGLRHDDPPLARPSVWIPNERFFSLELINRMLSDLGLHLIDLSGPNE